MVAQVGYPVTLWSDDLVSVTMNGSVYLLDSDARVTCNTDSGGKITIYAATADLGSPVYNLTTAALPADTMVSIQPNAQIQQTLLTVDGQTLQSQLNITNATTAQNAASALNAAMSAAPIAELRPEAAPSFLQRNRSLTGLHYRPIGTPSRGLINAAAVKDALWRVELRKGQVAFRTLTPEEHAALTAQEALLPSGNVFTDWLDDLGDLAEALAEDVVSAITYTVSAVGGVVTAVLTFVIDNISYYWSLTIDAIEQVFDIVKAIFSALAVAFDQLVQWLGFLFAWPDIFNTKDAFVTVLLQTLPLMNDCVESIRTQAKGGIETARTYISTNCDTVVGNLMGTTTSAGYNSANPSPQQMDQVAGINIVMTGFQTNNANSTLTPPASSPTPAGTTGASPVDDLWSLLQSQTGSDSSFQASPSFGEAIAYFQNAAGSNQFLQNAIAGTIKVLEGVADLALVTCEVIIDKFCDAIEGVINWMLDFLVNGTWSIPFVSQLYTAVSPTGEAMRPIDLICIIPAIPATVLYKLAFGAAPYNAAGLTELQANYTTSWLQQMCGSETTAAVATAAGAAPPGWRVTLSELGMIGAGLTLIFSGAMQAIMDAAVPLGVPGAWDPPQAVTYFGLASEWLLFAFNTPWLVDPTYNSVSSDETTFWLWMAGLLAPVVDSVCFLVTTVLQKGNSQIKITIARNTLGIIGIAVDFLVALCNFSVGIYSVIHNVLANRGSRIIGLSAGALVASFVALTRVARLPVILIGVETSLGIEPKVVCIAIAVADGLGNWVLGVADLIVCLGGNISGTPQLRMVDGHGGAALAGA